MMIMETVIPQLGHMETGLDGIETKFKQVCNDLEDLTQEVIQYTSKWQYIKLVTKNE